MDDVVGDGVGWQRVYSQSEKRNNGSSASLRETQCEFNSILNDTVSQMRAWEKKMSTELVRKDEEIVSLKKAVQQAESGVENMEHEVHRLNCHHQDTVSQMEAKWEKKMSIELGKKDKQILSFKTAVQQADSGMEQIETTLCEVQIILDAVVSQMSVEWQKKMTSTELEKKIDDLQQAKSEVENMKSEVCRLNQHLTLIEEKEKETQEMELLVKENAEMKVLAATSGRRRNRRRRTKKKKTSSTELDKKDEETLSLMDDLQQAKSEVENMKSEMCELKSVREDMVCQMEAEWEKKTITELEKKDEEIVTLKKAIQQAESGVKNMEHEVHRLNCHHQDTVSQMEAEWEKKMRIELEKKDEETLSLMDDLQQAKSEVENMKSEVCELKSVRDDMVCQMEAEWEKTRTELEKKDEEIVSLKKAVQQAESGVENMEHEVHRLNCHHQDTVSQMEAEWEKKMSIELGKKDKEILSLMDDLQQAESEVENMKSEVCELKSVRDDMVCQMEAEWEKKTRTELEKKDEEIVSLKKAVQQAESGVENMEHEVHRLNCHHQDTVSQMEAEWEKKMSIELGKKDKEILSFKKAVQQADSGMEQIETTLSEVQIILDAVVSQMSVEWQKKMTSTELEKKIDDLQQAKSEVENMKSEVCRLNQHLTLIEEKEKETQEMELLVKENAEMKVLATTSGRRRNRRRRTKKKTSSTELDKKDEEILSLMDDLQQAKSEVENIKSEVCELKSVRDDMVCQMEAEWEKKTRTELEKKDEEIVSLKKAVQQAESGVENMEHEVHRLNCHHQDTVSQMEAEWEKKMRIELGKKDEETLSLMDDLQQAKSEVENMKSEVCELKSVRDDMVCQMEAEWEKKTRTELEKKDEEIVSFKKAVQQAESGVENMEHEVHRLNCHHQDTVYQMEAEWEKKMRIELGKKDKEILSLMDDLQQAKSEVENMKSKVCELKSVRDDMVCQMEAEWEKKTRTELEKKDEEIVSLKKAVQQAESGVENMEHEVHRLNCHHQNTMSQMEAEWEKKMRIELGKKDKEILSFKKAVQQADSGMEQIETTLSEVQIILDAVVSQMSVEWQKKMTSTELEKKIDDLQQAKSEVENMKSEVCRLNQHLTLIEEKEK
ncbi:probable myosin heavy chain ECU04_1000 [Gouania willdenowi]|uniref:probable myosin heavy chain ECU04_1000 n=1 Tax=Gouania willdenowi TaxID=441366 RepID=UPI001054DA75|nr:probable myosin heavy chain ECU04_1000 [Gouania willdenowi]